MESLPKYLYVTLSPDLPAQSVSLEYGGRYVRVPDDGNNAFLWKKKDKERYQFHLINFHEKILK